MPDDVPQVSFSCANRRGGAVLSLPVDAQRQDTRSRGDFGKWMLKNIDSWFYFARGLGLGIEHMEEIVLVTGLHLTKSWATVAFFEGQSNAQASFGSRVVPGADVRINWRCLPGSVRGGMRSWGPEGNNLEENQCVLVRGFRVARVLGILPRRLRGAAGQNPSLEEDDDDDEPDKELISIGSVKVRYPDRPFPPFI
ncbi:hypothetical protein BJV74DRAFT_403429 [Russula compacta]|nr:hypothetical protein BJV74DRAFT_403429 [Russula compacta]